MTARPPILFRVASAFSPKLVQGSQVLQEAIFLNLKRPKWTQDRRLQRNTSARSTARMGICSQSDESDGGYPVLGCLRVAYMTLVDLFEHPKTGSPHPASMV